VAIPRIDAISRFEIPYGCLLSSEYEASFDNYHSCDAARYVKELPKAKDVVEQLLSRRNTAVHFNSYWDVLEGIGEAYVSLNDAIIATNSFAFSSGINDIIAGLSAYHAFILQSEIECKKYKVVPFLQPAHHDRVNGVLSGDLIGMNVSRTARGIEHEISRLTLLQEEEVDADVLTQALNSHSGLFNEILHYDDEDCSLSRGNIKRSCAFAREIYRKVVGKNYS
jgi:hypothetical protein